MNSYNVSANHPRVKSLQSTEKIFDGKTYEENMENGGDDNDDKYLFSFLAALAALGLPWSMAHILIVFNSDHSYHL